MGLVTRITLKISMACKVSKPVKYLEESNGVIYNGIDVPYVSVPIW